MTAVRARYSFRGILVSVFLVLAALAGWQVAATRLAALHALAGPIEIVRTMGDHAGLLARASAVTLSNALLGFVLGNAAGVLLAGLCLAMPRAERMISGLALLVFCLPLVATGPILRVLFGPGNGPQITLAALAVYYTTFVPLKVGLRATPAPWLELVRVYGRGRLAELAFVRLRAGLPYLFAGLQIAAPAAFLGALVGEFTGAERGLGVLTIRALNALDVSAAWAIGALAASVSILAYAAIGRLGRTLDAAPPPILLAPSDGSPRRTGHALLAALATLLVALALWWGTMAGFALDPFFAKRPLDLAGAFFVAPESARLRADLVTALLATASVLLPGYLAGLALGAGLAIAASLSALAARILLPAGIALRAVPIVTTAPLLLFALGRGTGGSIALVALMVFFPTLIACLNGLARAPGPILDLFRSYAAGPVSQLVQVRIPAMLPAFFAAARMAVPAAVLAVTVIEWLASGRGIGATMAVAASLSDYDMLWGCVVAVALLSAGLYAAVAAIEARVLARFAPEQGAA